MKRIFILVLFLTAGALADPSLKRVQEIKVMANGLARESMFNSIETSFDLELPNPAAALYLGNGKYKISINKNIFFKLSEAAQNFIGFHELGHIYLGHTEMEPHLKNRFELELEADTFAAFLVLKFGKMDQELFDFISFIESMTNTTPPGNVRAKLIREILTEND